MARSYIEYYRNLGGKFKNRFVDLKSDGRSSQVYLGVDFTEHNPVIKKAVLATKGEFLTYNGKKFVLVGRPPFLKIEPIPFAVFTTGFAGSALEVIILIGFQIIYGFMYYKIGLLITTFMIGLALNLQARRRWKRSDRIRGMKATDTPPRIRLMKFMESFLQLPQKRLTATRLRKVPWTRCTGNLLDFPTRTLRRKWGSQASRKEARPGGRRMLQRNHPISPLRIV